MDSKFITTAKLSLLSIFSVTTLFAQQSNLHLGNATIVSTNKSTNLPEIIRFSNDQNIKEGGFLDWLTPAFNLPKTISFKAYSVEKDELGFTHTRYKEYINNFPVDGTMLITHSKEDRLVSFNGDYFLNFDPNTNPAISEKQALANALKKVNATKYKWENKIQEAAKREQLHQPDFTYYPKGELVMVHKSGNDYSASSICLAYKFNIYAEKPLYRSYVFVDATTGDVISELEIIHTADVVGTANTFYSGTVPMTSDNFGSQYRLRETGRGNGIQTYNLNNSTNYSNTDFTNSSSTWNVTGVDQAASDAHWGAEMTYDYYMQKHNRNSIDGNGYTLLSYVHYDNNYVNAFWDGQEMTYGDGNTSQGFKIMTGLDVCGHEITHGLVSNTANLGSGEAGALNEAFADIFGTSVEAFARPNQNDWKMGAELMTSGTGIRNMSNPNIKGDPDTYQGTNWDPGGEVHQNAGPCDYWYYLLCVGGTGTNDNGDAFTVTGQTMAKAEKIAFRGLTVYFTSGTNYASARTHTIQAAVDLYGGCSPEVVATTNAWHAVGVGPAFTGAVSVGFTANSTSSCILPFVVGFINTSTNGSNATWYFGDGSTSTVLSPSHSYGTPGTYTVKLIMTGACGTDSVVQTALISVNPPPAPTGTGASSCTNPAVLTLNATGGGSLEWYAAPVGGVSISSGNSLTTPSLSATTTYYVESQNPGATGHVGPPTENSFGAGSYHNNTSTQYVKFDVLQPCTLQTALVNSGATGTRNLVLWDSAGTQLQSLPLVFPMGVATVTINLHLTPGSYRIGGTQMNLWRNNTNTGPGYPFTLSGTINMTGASPGNTYYYYFYNWQVQNDPCVSARVPVTATIGGMAVSYTVNKDTICSTDPALTLTGGTPAGGSYSGTGVSGSSFDPSVAGLGDHVITYTYTDSAACSNTATSTINVKECAVGIKSHVGSISGFSVYPNPADGNLNLEIKLSKEETLSVELMNAVGQLVFAEKHTFAPGNNKFDLKLNDIAKGIYSIKIKTSDSVMIQRVVMK